MEEANEERRIEVITGIESDTSFGRLELRISTATIILPAGARIERGFDKTVTIAERAGLS